MPDAEDLAPEYRQTFWLIGAPGAPSALRVDRQSPGLESLFLGAVEWAFITANSELRRGE